MEAPTRANQAALVDQPAVVPQLRHIHAAEADPTIPAPTLIKAENILLNLSTQNLIKDFKFISLLIDAGIEQQGYWAVRQAGDFRTDDAVLDQVLQVLRDEEVVGATSVLHDVALLWVVVEERETFLVGRMELAECVDESQRHQLLHLLGLLVGESGVVSFVL